MRLRSGHLAAALAACLAACGSRSGLEVPSWSQPNGTDERGATVPRAEGTGTAGSPGTLDDSVSGTAGHSDERTAAPPRDESAETPRRDEPRPGADRIAPETCDGIDNDGDEGVDEGARVEPLPDSDVRVSGDVYLAERGGVTTTATGYALTYAAQREPAGDTTGRLKAVGRDGTAAPGFDEVPLTLVNADSFGGDVAWTGDVYGVAWQERRNGDFEVYFNRFDGEGRKLGPDVRVSDAPGFSIGPALTWTGQEFLVTWIDHRRGLGDVLGSVPRGGIYAQRIDAEGRLDGDNVLLSARGFDALVGGLVRGASDYGLLVLADGVRGHSIVFQRVSADFARIGPANVVVEDEVEDLDMVWQGDRFVVSWHPTDGGAPSNRLLGVALDEDGVALDGERELVRGPSFVRSASLLSLGEQLLVVWSDFRNGDYDLYAQLLTRDLDAAGPEIRVTDAAGDSLFPTALLADDGDIGIFFDDTRDDGGAWQVFFTRLACRIPGQP